MSCNTPTKVFAAGQGTAKVFQGCQSPDKVFAGIGNMSALDATPSPQLASTGSGFVSNLVPVIGACRNEPDGNIVCQ